MDVEGQKEDAQHGGLPRALQWSNGRGGAWGEGVANASLTCQHPLSALPIGGKFLIASYSSWRRKLLSQPPLLLRYSQRDPGPTKPSHW